MTTTMTYLTADIPVLAVRPDAGRSNGRLAVWMHFLAGSKERMESSLQRLAEGGFTAVSFDAWQHGARAVESPPELMDAVFAAFRARMWPILGHSVLDAVTVIDDALERFNLAGEVVAGGVSMGGDLAVALAGADRRISRVAAVIATPDWARPGMTVLDDASSLLDQGFPTRTGQWLYERLDPMTHLDDYLNGTEIAFDLGGADQHIPQANADAFRTALIRLEPATADWIRVRTHEGLDHLAAGRDPRVLNAALDFLLDRSRR